MKAQKYHFAWLSHVIPVTTAIVALALLFLTPFWAVRAYRLPFLGLLLEPNNVVSKITAKDWVGAEAGARWPDQLAAINQQPVAGAADVYKALSISGDEEVVLTFRTLAGGQTYDLTIKPMQMPGGDFISLFIVPYLVGVIFLVIGLWAYRLRTGLRASRALLVFSAAVSIAASTFFDMNTTRHAVALWTASLPLAASACIHLALVFPKQMHLVDRMPAVRFISWLLCLVFAVPAVYEVLNPSAPLAYISRWQTCYLFMALAIMLLLLALIWRLIRSDSPVVRQQSRVIVFGAMLAFAPLMLFYLLPTSLGAPQEFSAAVYFPLMILLPLSITYAILRYRLLDIDRFLASVLTYAILTAGAVVFFFGLVTLLSVLINRRMQPDNPLLIALYILALVLGLSPLQRLVQRGVDRLFYRAPADYRRALNVLANSLVVSPDMERTLGTLQEQLQQALAPESFFVYLYDDTRARYLPHDPGKAGAPEFTAEDPLVHTLRAASAALFLPPGGGLPAGFQTTSAFERLGCSAFVPLLYEGNLTGFLALGGKRSGEPYTRDDLEFLSTVAGQSALALENARLFTNLRRTLDQTLEMKNLMDDIFASIATGVITTDVERKVTLFNRASEEILGIAMKDVLGKPLPDALPLCPDMETVASEAVEHGVVTLAHEINRNIPPRGELYLRLSCSPLRDAYLATKGATIVFEDLTERRKLLAEQERIRQTFGRVVAPRVRDRLLSDPSHLHLEGTRQVTTILFADISGFTSFSEHILPEALFKTLNLYLSLAAQAILDEEGTLDKFWGDGVLALWNTPDPQPDHCLRAARTALNILQRARVAHRLFDDPLYHLNFHIGISTGEAMVGNVGTGELFNYTAVGDTVNVAQRLEASALPGQILIDQATCQELAGLAEMETLEPLQVKGRSQPIRVFHLKKLV